MKCPAVAVFHLLLCAGIALAADDATPKRVLLVHSFGRDSAPFGAVVSSFRTELVRHFRAPVVFYEVPLEAGQHGAIGDDKPVVEFLQSRFAERAPDLLVAIGPPAARFCAEHRVDLFPDTPRMLTGEERLVRDLPAGPRDAIVAPRIALRVPVEFVLSLLPQTERIAVVLGNSPPEIFWARELRRELAVFAERVGFIWLNERPFDEMRRDVAQLPERSAILYAMLTVDKAGIPYEGDTALSQLRAVANAPIFGIFEEDLGHGIVGGYLVSQRDLGVAMGKVGARMLRGEASESGPMTIVETRAASLDWRELQRWNIPGARLPPHSIVKFRQPSAWEQYRLTILGVATLILLQAALIGALVVYRMRRRRAEREVLDMSGRLIRAHEDERRRLAGELHDDLTQRLARLAIDSSRLEHGADADSTRLARSIRDGLVRISEDVHALSYRLHPSMLDDLGLVAALRAECDRVARNEPIAVVVDIGDMPERLAPDVALCLFRIAQEALANVVRHAGARHVTVSLRPADGGLQLSVADDGGGLDPAARREPSLGLASMAERARQLGGRLHIASAPGRGTRISAWVALA